MRILFALFLFTSVNCVLTKNNVKSLTESMGQEVIEIGGPSRDLPADLEEEPSAELEEDEKVITSTTLLAATKKDTKKTTPLAPERRNNKDYNKIDEDSKQEDEEMRIEKELAEIYKDNLDYKADSSEATVKVTSPDDVEEETKPIARARATNFKFQPDLNNKAEVERFRTSVDEISCDKRLAKLKEPELTTRGSCGKKQVLQTISTNEAARFKITDSVFFGLFATVVKFSSFLIY